MSRKGDPADLAEFGDADLSGSPTIAQLIRALPEERRESYRAERRAAVAAFCAQLGIPVCTYAEYMQR